MGNTTKVAANVPATKGPLESNGSSSFAPPAFSLDAGPLQLKSNCDPEKQSCLEEDAGALSLDHKNPDMCMVGDPEPVVAAVPPKIDTAAAIAHNNKMEFRLDWVRNLQLSLLGKRVSTDGSFDTDTVNAVAIYQRDTMKVKKPTGKIDAATRKALELSYAVLYNKVTGTNLEPRILVPGEANDEEKFGYWKGVVSSAGGVFLSDAMAMNLVGIRGVLVADGTAAHQIGGKALSKGTVYQSSSAKEYVEARKADKFHRHTSGDHEGFDDMIVSLWVDAKGVKNVQQRIGNVDPGDLYKDDKYGTGHLTDGQYAYELGTHGTSSASHQKAVKGISDPDNTLDLKEENGKTRYKALRPTRNQEVWREHDTNDRSVSEKEENTSRERIYDRNDRYVNDNFAMNIHTSRTTRPNSQACMNVPADQYLGFIKEVIASSNQKNVLYTLIDASKLEAGLKIVRSGKP